MPPDLLLLMGGLYVQGRGHMHNYINWKRSTVQANTLKLYIRWVYFFTTVCNKENDFKIEDIVSFKNFLERSLYSPKNIQYGLSIIKDYINYLISVEGLDFPVHLFRIKQERSNSHVAVTHEEYIQMLKVLPPSEPQGLQRRVMFMMLYDTGMRVGELVSLKISDLKGRHAVINNEKNKRQRLVAWSEETNKFLKKYLLLREHLITTEDWVFMSFKWKSTRQLSTRQIERIVEQVRKSAKIERLIRPHSFRHGFVHRKLDEGKPVTTVAQMLGHSTTINVLTYAQLSSVEIRSAWDI